MVHVVLEVKAKNLPKFKRQELAAGLVSLQSEGHALISLQATGWAVGCSFGFGWFCHRLIRYPLLYCPHPKMRPKSGLTKACLGICFEIGAA